MKGPAYRLNRCVVCGGGGANADVVADVDDVRAEVEALWEYHQRRLAPDTPPERLMDRVAFSQPPPFQVVRCRGCGIVYRNPVEQERELRDIYAADAPPRETLAALHDAQRLAWRTQCDRLASVLRRREPAITTGLEVGSYVGAFLAAARDCGLAFEGLDVNPAVNAFVRSLGYRVVDGDLSGPGDVADPRTFGIVAIWNTFDQLPDPRGALAIVWRMLAPNGILAIRVPNGGFYARLSRHLARKGAGAGIARALLAQNNLLSFPYRFGFTPRALARLLGEAGFSVERVFGDVLVPTTDEWTRGWARIEERAIKAAWRLMAQRRAALAPWVEVYARK